MNKEFVNYDQALALKDLGFDEPCFGYYFIDDPKKELRILVNDHNWTNTFHAPIYQQAFRWFREKYDLHPYVETFTLTTTGENRYDYTISITEGEESDDGKRWRTYDEAQSACLHKLIELVKTN